MSYPLLGVIGFFLLILWIYLLVRVIADIFSSRDIGGSGKASWQDPSARVRLAS